jgi:hypothetical protein
MSCGTSPWRPIETAPRDGTLIDIWCDGERLPDCCWDPHGFGNTGWQQKYAEVPNFFPINGTPTHWMPRPEAPRI